MIITIVTGILVLILAPVVGGLLAGLERIISARMQRRKGPPLLQPFYDVYKLLRKQTPIVSNFTRNYLIISLLFSMMTVLLFFLGADLLLCIFSLTLASIFLTVAGYSTSSPYSLLGADRELLTIMAYEPMVLLTVISFYYVTKSFSVASILSAELPMIVQLPLIFVGFLYILTFKFRKSPFDLSTSHHGHQEIVKGLTTEFAGKDLALVEIIHWYETVFTLGLVYLFFAFQPLYSHFLAIGICVVVFLFETVIDNSFARVKWQLALKTSWAVTGAAALINLCVLYFI